MKFTTLFFAILLIGSVHNLQAQEYDDQGYDDQGGYDEPEVAQQDLGCDLSDLRCLREQRDADYDHCMFKLSRGFMAQMAQQKCEAARTASAQAASKYELENRARNRAALSLQPAPLIRLSSSDASADQPERIARRSFGGASTGPGVRAVNRSNLMARKAKVSFNGGPGRRGPQRIAQKGRSMNNTAIIEGRNRLSARGSASNTLSSVNYKGARNIFSKPSRSNTAISRSAYAGPVRAQAQDQLEQRAPIVQSRGIASVPRFANPAPRYLNAKPSAYRPVTRLNKQAESIDKFQNYE